jgi:hypothetical protein
MKKEELIAAVKDCGDAIINYRSMESQKAKYNVCTLEFDNDYIRLKQNRAKEDDDTVLMFCWDVDAYRLLKASNVTSVVALNSALKDGKRGR